MKEIYSIRKISLPLKLEAYVDLCKVCFPNDEKLSKDYFHWLYVANPEGQAIGYDAFYNDELVAHYVVIPRKYTNGKKLFKCALSVNTATHPSHQGKGLFTLLANKTYDDLSLEGYDFVLGIANKNSIYGFLKKLDFSLIGNVKLGVFMKPISFNSGIYKFMDDEWLSWKFANPSMRYKFSRSNEKVIVSVSVRGVRFYLTQFESSFLTELRKTVFEKKKLLSPLGFTPYFSSKHRYGVHLPAFLQPSPWYVIVKNISSTFGIEDLQDICVDGISMDTF